MSRTKMFIHFVGKLQHTIMFCADWSLHACVYLFSLADHCCSNKLPLLTHLCVSWSLLTQRSTWCDLFLLDELPALEMLPRVC